MPESKIWVFYKNNLTRYWDWNCFDTVEEAKAFSASLQACDWVALRGEPDLLAFELDDAFKEW